MFRVVVVHGWGAHPEEGWRPWLRQELVKLGFKVEVPTMPHTEFPEVHAWVSHLAEVVDSPGEDVVLVGHSLGCITILRYLESLPAGSKIRGCLLVAGPYRDLGIKELATFFAAPLMWKRIRSHCRRFMAIHSDNDYWIPVSHAAIAKKNLGAEVIMMPGWKHFSSADGCLELPAALEAVLKLAEIAA